MILFLKRLFEKEREFKVILSIRNPFGCYVRSAETILKCKPSERKEVANEWADSVILKQGRKMYWCNEENDHTFHYQIEGCEVRDD